MKVRLPAQNQGMNLQKLAQQAQMAQQEAERITDELEQKEYTATSGGEAVKVTIIGKPEIKKIEIKPEVVDPDDIEMLSDMIIAATNEAIKKASDEKDQAMQRITGSMSMPGLF